MKVVELFAGVGGFHAGLERSGFEVVWASQWEPGKKQQHAADCYRAHFPDTPLSNDDIASVDPEEIPEHDLLVGGFPCQDYSVATTKAQGIVGKKGVLWWEINRIAEAKMPKYLLLENVDRLLRSPTKQRGRDFAVVLACLAKLGYRVEWRTINAADYGFPQKRRRTFIFAAHEDTGWGKVIEKSAASPAYLGRTGFFSAPFPIREEAVIDANPRDHDVKIPASIQKVSDAFAFDFRNSGVMVDRKVWTKQVSPLPSELSTLRSILEPKVDAKYFVPKKDVARWRYLKGSKAEERKTKEGFAYHYTEGAIPFPDNLDTPSRTLITNEGGTSPSRFKHIVKDPATGELRVLTPVEAEKLNGFDPGWTASMPERWRYFCMGNALVVGLIEKMGARLAATTTPAKAQKAKKRNVQQTLA